MSQAASGLPKPLSRGAMDAEASYTSPCLATSIGRFKSIAGHSTCGHPQHALLKHRGRGIEVSAGVLALQV